MENEFLSNVIFLCTILIVIIEAAIFYVLTNGK